MDSRSADPLRGGVSVPNGATGGDLIVGMGCPERARASSEQYYLVHEQWQHEAYSLYGVQDTAIGRAEQEDLAVQITGHARHLRESRDQVTAIRCTIHLVRKPSSRTPGDITGSTPTTS